MLVWLSMYVFLPDFNTRFRFTFNKTNGVSILVTDPDGNVYNMKGKMDTNDFTATNSFNGALVNLNGNKIVDFIPVKYITNGEGLEEIYEIFKVKNNRNNVLFDTEGYDVFKISEKEIILLKEENIKQLTGHDSYIANFVGNRLYSRILTESGYFISGYFIISPDSKVDRLSFMHLYGKVKNPSETLSYKKGFQIEINGYDIHIFKPCENSEKRLGVMYYYDYLEGEIEKRYYINTCYDNLQMDFVSSIPIENVEKVTVIFDSVSSAVYDKIPATGKKAYNGYIYPLNVNGDIKIAITDSHSYNVMSDETPCTVNVFDNGELFCITRLDEYNALRKYQPSPDTSIFTRDNERIELLKKFLPHIKKIQCSKCGDGCVNTGNLTFVTDLPLNDSRFGMSNSLLYYFLYKLSKHEYTNFYIGDERLIYLPHLAVPPCASPVPEEVHDELEIVEENYESRFVPFKWEIYDSPPYKEFLKYIAYSKKYYIGIEEIPHIGEIILLNGQLLLLFFEEKNDTVKIKAKPFKPRKFFNVNGTIYKPEEVLDMISKKYDVKYDIEVNIDDIMMEKK